MLEALTHKMVYAKRNKDCRVNPEGCYLCKCGKHHNCKDGAMRCCSKTKEPSTECNCRHCTEKT